MCNLSNVVLLLAGFLHFHVHATNSNPLISKIVILSTLPTRFKFKKTVQLTHYFKCNSQVTMLLFVY